MAKIGDGKPAGSKKSSPMGLGLGFTGERKVAPKVTAPWDQVGVNSLLGKGKVPMDSGGVSKGKGNTPASKMSAQVGKPMAPGVGGSHGAKSPRGAAAGKAKANSTQGPKALGKMILKKKSVTGQSQTVLKAPQKEPRPTGVPVAKSATNWHATLGFGGRSKP